MVGRSGRSKGLPLALVRSANPLRPATSLAVVGRFHLNKRDPAMTTSSGDRAHLREPAPIPHNSFILTENALFELKQLGNALFCVSELLRAVKDTDPEPLADLISALSFYGQRITDEATNPNAIRNRP
jgi:hypothetical protein